MIYENSLGINFYFLTACGIVLFLRFKQKLFKYLFKIIDIRSHVSFFITTFLLLNVIVTYLEISFKQQKNRKKYCYTTAKCASFFFNNCGPWSES